MKENESVQHPASAGFTMGEMVIVLAVIAILAALITPLAVNQVTQARYDAAREELLIIKQAIVGDPSLIEGGVRSSYGFVGDLGVMPVSLQELVTNPNGLPIWQRDAPSRLWWGWRGPYISEYTDPWGRNYSYLIRVATIADHTRIAVWSLGPDGADSSSDDIMNDISGTGDDSYGDDSSIIRVYEDDLQSTVSGNVTDPCGAQAPCDVANPTVITIYYPNGTAIIQTLSITLNTGIPIFDTATTATPQLPIGVRAINATIPYIDATGNQIGNVIRFIYINNGPLTSVNLRPAGACN